jgi:hypothetical protein
VWVQDGQILYCGAIYIGKIPTKFTEPIAFIDGIDAAQDIVKLLICDASSMCSVCEVDTETKSIKMVVLNLATDK